jgi:hypothetical protein
LFSCLSSLNILSTSREKCNKRTNLDPDHELAWDYGESYHQEQSRSLACRPCHHLFVKKEKQEPWNNIICKIDSKNIWW